MAISSGGMRSNKIVFLLIAILMILVFLGSLTFLQKIYQTEDYWVLKANMPTRSQITPDDLTRIETSKEGVPPGALGPKDVQGDNVFTRYPLRAGEILTLSNTGGLDDIATGLPDSWVVTSFPVTADNAVGGRIARGTYFDMMIAASDGAFYPFVNVLTLDTSTSLSGASGSDAVNTQEAKAGQTSIYYVGMSPGDAAILQTVVAKHGGNMKLVLSPRENEYQAPNLEAYEGIFSFDKQNYELKNSGLGTNNTFIDGKRDEMGRPGERDDKGNVKYLDKCGNGANSIAKNDEPCTVINNDTYTPEEASEQSIN